MPLSNINTSRSSIFIVLLGIIAIVIVWYLNIPEHANTPIPAFDDTFDKIENTEGGVVDPKLTSEVRDLRLRLRHSHL